MTTKVPQTMLAGEPALFGVKGADLASAGTLNLDGATGDFAHVTGTTGITAITLTSGRVRATTFDGVLVLTNGASLILPTGANITTAAGDTAIWRGEPGGVVRCIAYVRADGSPVALVTAAMLAATLDLSAKALTLSAAQKAQDYVEIRDEKAANTAGGGFTSGAWQTRDLNTESFDTGSLASVASNQITLAAGTYNVEIRAPGNFCNGHKAKLYNVTDAADVLIGTSEWSGTGATIQSSSVVTGRFTIAAPKVLEVRHRCTTTRATDGFGVATNVGVNEVYTIARFWRVG